MKSSEFISRRSKLVDKMADNSVLILFSGLPIRSSADATYGPFHANRNFYYLTGIDQQNSVLLIVKADQAVSTYLFIDEYDAHKEKWTGKVLLPIEAGSLSGIHNVLVRSTLDTKISEVLKKENNQYGQIERVYLDFDQDGPIMKKITLKEFQFKLANEYGYTAEDIFNEIVLLRMVKSPEEISALRQAIQITNEGLELMVSKLAPEMYEYQARALFEFVLDYGHHTEVSFDTIAASGENGVILHYPQLDRLMQSGDLLMTDLGAKYDHYCADISRTYPVNGKFSPIQAKIYDIVVECNKAVINYIKPGLTRSDLQKFTIEFLTKNLLAAKLIDKAEDISEVYYHNVSHHLGLDTHDVSLLDLPLAPGNVVTVEPGLYFKKYNIGIRIEDDVLVTPTGSENLSKIIIKERKDIEAYFKHR